MFSLDNVMLLESFNILAIEIIKYNDIWLGNIYGEKYLILELLILTLFVLFTKNSIQIGNLSNLNIKSIIFFVLVTIVSLLYLEGVHEFLYFNF